MSDLEEAVLSLARIGLDSVEGVLAGGFDAWRDASMPVSWLGTTTPQDLENAPDPVRILDVRDDNEFEDEGHIPDASHLYVGYIDQHFREVDPPINKADRIAVTCSVGHRASLAASVLRRHGFARIDNLLGGMTAWKKSGRSTETGATNTVTTPEVEGVRL